MTDEHHGMEGRGEEEGRWSEDGWWWESEEGEKWYEISDHQLITQITLQFLCHSLSLPLSQDCSLSPLWHTSVPIATSTSISPTILSTLHIIKGVYLSTLVPQPIVSFLFHWSSRTSWSRMSHGFASSVVSRRDRERGSDRRSERDWSTRTLGREYRKITVRMWSRRKINRI